MDEIKLQLENLFSSFDKLQEKFWDKNLNSVYGAGCINKPNLFFIFMNPTWKNISADKKWQWLQAPWLGTKNIWKLFHKIGLIPKNVFDQISSMKALDRKQDFCLDLYRWLAQDKVYISNLAKCTQSDARHLHDNVFKEYLKLIFQEIDMIQPKKIICFGNQVSSILLGKNIKVSDYQKDEHEEINIKNKTYKIYPSFYPVWQGMRNMGKTIIRIKIILDL